MVRPIGVIDSGVGGLTVVKEMLKRLPNESIIYIGDDKRCPYGSRTPEEVRAFTIEMASALSKMDIKMLVIACNTATAVALEDIRRIFDFPVIGVISPGARAAVATTQTNKIAVLGTTRTIESGAYSEEILRQSPEAMVYPLACPEFVPLVEKGQYKTDHAKHVIEQRLQDLSGKSFDVAVLGCTHYPLLESHIQSSLPAHVRIVSSAVETVHDVKSELKRKELTNKEELPMEPVFYTTGPQEAFQIILSDWLEIDHPKVSTITL